MSENHTHTHADGTTHSHSEPHTHTHADGTVHTHSHSDTPHGHYHSPEIKKKELNRISKAIGHLQHVKVMIENDEDCADVLMQLSAVRSAVNNLGKEIINEHIEHCLIHAVEDGHPEALDEFRDAVRKFM